MPPGQTVPTGLSFAAAKKVCTPQDFERLAAVFLSATETVNYDADKAARDLGGGKAESFKRSIWVITKKIKEYNEKMGDEDAEDGDGEEPVAPKTGKVKGRGKKRKAVEDDDEEVVKKKGKKVAKKVKGESENGDHAIVKAEEGGDDDDGGFLV